MNFKNMIYCYFRRIQRDFLISQYLLVTIKLFITKENGLSEELDMEFYKQQV